jgi:ribosomal protein S11
VTKDLAAATAAYRAAQKRIDAGKAEVRAGQDDLKQARQALGEALVAEARAGTRMRDLVAQTGLSREWIRTRLRQAGFTADD